uniref:PAS domain S-box protein n=1 Tax=Nitrospira cf. moscoviensis SBR1015 TaxID=96242 RepID=UPI0011812C91
YFSERWKTMIGYEDHEFANVYHEWESRLHPDDRARVMSGLTDYLQRRLDVYDVEFRLRKKDGTYCWIHARGKAVWDAEGCPIRMAGSHTDITERIREEMLQAAEKQTLELVAMGYPLQEVLTFFCRAIEAHTAPMLSSVMLVTKDKSHLSAVAGPSLSSEYSRLIDCIPIGPTIGSCGSAAYFRQPAIVCDIATDPLWKGYAHHALDHGLKACWSQPVVSPTGTLLGTFAAYFREPRAPEQRDLRLLEQAGRIAALAIEHARSVEAVRESEERFRLIFLHEPECVKTVAPDGTLLTMNPAGLRMVEADSLEEVVGRSVMPLIHPDDRSAFWEMHCAAVNGSPRTLEFRIIGRKGQLRWMDTHSVPLRETGGMITAVLSVTRDITERKRLEQSGRDHHDRLRLAMDIAGLAIWDWNILTNEVVWSENCEQVKRLPAGSFEGTFDAYQRLVHPEDLPGLHADIESALSGRKPYHTEHRIVPPSGEVQWLEGNGVVYRDELGRPARMVGTVRNITGRKRGEQTLRLSEERYARATAVGQVGVWELDVRAGTYYGDKNLKAMFGYQGDELSTDPYAWLSIVHPDDQSIAMAHWQRIVRGETDDYQYELRMVRKDGRSIWTDVRGHAVRDADGQVTHLIGATLDITDRKRMEEALRDSEERHRSVVAAMAEGVVIQDGRGVIRACNASACRILGLTEDQILGRTSLDPQWKTIHEDGSPFPGETHPIVRTLRTGRPCEHVVMGVYRPDGSIVWISINTQPIASGSDRPLLGVVASFRDITGQRQQEAELKLFRTLLDQVTDSIEVIDPSTGRFLDGNRQSYESIGYTREELSRLTVPDIDPLVSAPAFQQYMQHLREADVPLRIESVHLRKDGTTFPVEVVAQIIRRTKEYVVAVVRDITERKRSE